MGPTARPDRTGDRPLKLAGAFDLISSSWLVLAASSASSARPGGFDPASTLSWSVPLLLLAPLFGFVVVITGPARRAESR